MNAEAEVLDAIHGEAEQARREFLTCKLGEESYGIDILQVQEIREIDLVTRIPHVARFVRGVINLRGAIVPVVDLGLMFGFPSPIDLKTASADRPQRGPPPGGPGGLERLRRAGARRRGDPARAELGDRAIGAADRRHRHARRQQRDALDVDHLMRRVREERE
jgi:hypothetical protein